MTKTFQGIILTNLAVFLFSTANIPLKLMKNNYHVIQILTIRNMVAIALLGAITVVLKGRNSLKTTRLNIHFARGFASVISLSCLFYGLILLPLSHVTVVQFLNTFFMIIFSYIFLRENLTLKKLGIIFCGFLGIYIVANPQGMNFNSSLLWVMAHAFVDAGLIIHGRHLTKSRPPLNVVFWDCVFAFLVCAIILSIYNFFGVPVTVIGTLKWQPINFHDGLMMIALGLGGGLGQFSLIKAAQLAPAQIIAPFIYTSLIWAVFYDIMLFDYKLKLNFIMGTTLIILSGLYSPFIGNKGKK